MTVADFSRVAPRLAAAALICLVAGCSSLVDPAAPHRGPADPNARMAPELIAADPPRVAPGEVLALTFRGEFVRGIHFVLEARDGGDWNHRYDLLSDGPGPGWERSWHPAGAANLAIPDIGVGGPGPDRVDVPPVAEPGDWRICTGNAGDNVCAPIEIVSP